MELRALLDFYTKHVEEQLLPFWIRAADRERGGVYTGYSNDGSVLTSTDKYTWSQGRFLWIWSRLSEQCARGWLNGESERFLKQAERTFHFLREHAFMENGNCAFLLTEDGKRLKDDTSFFADCYVILGFSEFARVTTHPEALHEALRLFDSVERRLAAGTFRCEPYSVPAGMKAHSVPMIMLHVANVLCEALEELKHARLTDMLRACERYGTEIMTVFLQPDGRVAEYVSLQPQEPLDRLLLRHVNPGHAIECMWFVLTAAERLGKPEWKRKALDAIRQAYQLGWDHEYGGLLRFVDAEGGKPEGQLIRDPYETLILNSWDTKLWWPHSESLFATLYGYQLKGGLAMWQLFEKTHRYTFDTFPNRDQAVGEWIQIRGRDGKPSNVLAALPVKDPFHILRDCMLIIELLHIRLQ